MADPRWRVDLKRLPVAAQYALALVVVAAVVGLALVVGGDDEGPGWLEDTLPPILGVLAIIVAVGLLVARLRRRR